MKRVLLGVIFCLAAVPGAGAQLTARSVGWGDALSTVLGGALFVTPRVFGIIDQPSSCAPCDRAGVPRIDRVAIVEPRKSMRTWSTVALVGIGLLSWVDMGQNGEAGRDEIAASVQSLTWTAGLTEWLKSIVKRKRPVLYTELAPQFANVRDTQRSWPSGHTSVAVAIATSYALSSKRVTTQQAGVAAGLTLAASVGVMRVLAGAHFPTDVLSGAAIGSLTTVAVHAIKF